MGVERVRARSRNGMGSQEILGSLGRADLPWELIAGANSSPSMWNESPTVGITLSKCDSDSRYTLSHVEWTSNLS